MAGAQSSTVDPDVDRGALIDEMESKIATSSNTEPPSNNEEWQVWLIAPQEVEFWQGAKDRNHDRLKYKRKGKGWERTTLWP
jgi:pyridoxamine 5'-phosphate oxidase